MHTLDSIIYSYKTHQAPFTSPCLCIRVDQLALEERVCQVQIIFSKDIHNVLPILINYIKPCFCSHTYNPLASNSHIHIH